MQNILFVITIAFLFIYIVLMKRKIKYMCTIVDDVLNGNLNQRIRFQNRDKFLNNLGVEINKLINKVQNLHEKGRINEESRKKMISNISHDLRTPLTSMLGYMELILDDDNLDDCKKKEYLKIIQYKGDCLYGLMEEFFEISKLDSEEIKVKLKRVNISEIIRQTIISFFTEFQKINIDPELALGINDIFIVSDEKILGRILSNLINNAVKHGIGSEKIGVCVTEKEGFIYIEVWDNGRGISEEDISHIFDRLYMAEKSRNSALKNSGLGLAIVKKLTESIDGTISVESIPYERTSFILRLRNM